MGKVFRFDPRKRRRDRRAWTSAEDYRQRRMKPPKPSKYGKRQRRSSWGRAFRETWVWMLIIFGVTFYAVFGDARRYGGPGFVQVEEGVVSGSFTICEDEWAQACVTDGDTFRIGDRRIRVIGIDTAEKQERCPAEAEQARASTVALREWLNRGPFVMQARMDEPTDRYGRELRTLYRRLPSGEVEYVSDWMVQHGGARVYWGYERDEWC